MSDEIGYIPLFRKLRSNPIWTEKRTFSKAEAWIDILLEVQHDENPQDVVIGFATLKCNQGESLKSLLTWASRWNWDKNKVVRFFKLLSNMKMIVTNNETKTTRLRVLNYKYYRDLAKRKTNANETQTKRKKTQTGTDNNVKNEKNVNKTPPKSPKGDSVDKKSDSGLKFPTVLNVKKFICVWHDWVKFRKEIKKPLTETAVKQQIKKLSQMGVDKAILAINNSIERGYQGIFEPDERDFERSKANSSTEQPKKKPEYKFELG